MLKIKSSKIDSILDSLCLIILVGTLIFIIGMWSKMSNQIPRHYDINGNIDEIGSKTGVIYSYIITLIMYIFMSMVEKFASIWQSEVKEREENKDKLYTTALHFLSFIKFLIVFEVACLIVCNALCYEPPKWILILSIEILGGTVLYGIMKLFNIKLG